MSDYLDAPKEVVCAECAEVIPYTPAALLEHKEDCPLAEYQIHKPELLQHIVNMSTALEEPSS